MGLKDISKVIGVLSMLPIYSSSCASALMFKQECMNVKKFVTRSSSTIGISEQFPFSLHYKVLNYLKMGTPSCSCSDFKNFLFLGHLVPIRLVMCQHLVTVVRNCQVVIFCSLPYTFSLSATVFHHIEGACDRK